MFGTNKPNTKLGKFMEKNKITIIGLAAESGLDRVTIGGLARGNTRGKATRATKTRIVRALRRMGYDVDENDYWD